MVEIHPIREYREAQTPPLSQEAFGAIYGVTAATVSRWEAGVRKIEGDMLRRISKGAGIPVSRLRPDLAALLHEAAE